MEAKDQWGELEHWMGLRTQKHYLRWSPEGMGYLHQFRVYFLNVHFPKRQTFYLGLFFLVNLKQSEYFSAPLNKDSLIDANILGWYLIRNTRNDLFCFGICKN